MSSAETTDDVRAIAGETVTLIEQRMVTPLVTAECSVFIAAAALARLGCLLRTQLASRESDYEVLVLCAHAAMRTWLTGHAALLLGDEAAQSSLEDLAHLLDDTVYGESDRPKAFRRHLRSFFDEIDIEGADGTSVWLARYIDRGAVAQVRTSPVPTDSAGDFVRVGLWVTLFLAHDYFDAIGEPATARSARVLFDRLRRATDDFYARRKADAMRAE